MGVLVIIEHTVLPFTAVFARDFYPQISRVHISKFTFEFGNFEILDFAQ